MSAADVQNGFGELLRSFRRAAGLTQEELAERSGLSVRAVSDMERGRTARPFSRSMRLLADALALTDAAREELFSTADAADPAEPPGPAEVPGPAGAPGPAEVAYGEQSGPPWWLVPRQLPAGVGRFTGRSTELATLDKLATLDAMADSAPEPAPVIVLSGTAGVGKTTLALHWAHQAADRFPDGQLYVNLHGFGPSGDPVAPTAALRGFCTAFGVPADQIPADLEARAALYRSLLADRRVLVMLDNARDAEQVRPLLPGRAACQVIVTSRDPLLTLAAAEAAVSLTLDLPGSAQALELLAARLGYRNLADEEEALGLLADCCARLPLALSVAAARAAAHPEFSIASMVTELREARDRLTVLDNWDPASSVRAAFTWSYQNLSTPATRIFRRLGVHPGPDITAPAAASVCDVTRARARELLAELARGHLLTEHAPGRFACHDLLRAYAVERVREAAQTANPRDVLRRTLDHYLHTAHAADRLLDPSREPVALTQPMPGVRVERLTGYAQASAWFAAETRVLLAVVEKAARTGEDAYAWQLPRVMETYLVRQGRWQELAVVHRGALAAARRQGDPAARAHSRRGLGLAFALLGSRDEARDCLAEALELFGQLGDRAGQARTHSDAGLACGRAGRFREALGHATQAIELYQRAGLPGGLAGALSSAGRYQAGLGQWEQAVASCEESLEIFRTLGDSYGVARTLDTLGSARCALGDYPRGISCYQEALGLLREAQEHVRQAEVLAHLTESQRAADDAAPGNPRPKIFIS